jgi:hypothetical protein
MKAGKSFSNHRLLIWAAESCLGRTYTRFLSFLLTNPATKPCQPTAWADNQGGRIASTNDAYSRRVKSANVRFYE